MKSRNYKEILPQITTLIFDIDGVLTDGKVIVHPSGEKLRSLNSKDGFALQLAVKSGLNVCIISGGNCLAVKEALKKLGITDIFLMASHKLEVFNEYLAEKDIKPENCLYMGDDLPDFEVMKSVALPVCPKDAAPEIKKISLYVSPLSGGNGCVRDVVEQVLKSQNKWRVDELFKW